MAELRILTGEGEEHVLPLVDRALSFGRADDCDFTMTEQKASRQHCSFAPVGEGWRVVDNQSSNGTWLGGKPVLSARLQPGDEVEIGETVIEYVGQAATTAPRSPRERRRRKARTPWEALVVPVVLAIGASMLAGQLRTSAEADAGQAWTSYARAVAERAELPGREAVRESTVSELVEEMKSIPGARGGLLVAQEALQRATAAARGPAETEDPQDAAVPAWQRTLDAIESGRGGLSAGERRARLRQVLERSGSDAAAVEAVRQILFRDQMQAAELATADLGRVRREAEEALSAGHLGRAVGVWDAWVRRAPMIDREQEREVAGVLADVRERANQDAQAAFERFEAMVGEGKRHAAQSQLESTVDRLRGTGFGRLLDDRARMFLEARDGPRIRIPTAGGGAKGARSTVTSRERSRALRALASAEDLARVRRFDEAAARLKSVAAELTGATLKGELSARAADLERESALVTALFERVEATPAKFTPMRLEEGSFQVVGAGSGGLVVATSKQSAYTWSLDSLPGAAFVHLFARSDLQGPELVSAALFFHDIGEQDAAVYWMRKAVSVDELRMDASVVWARILGEDLPDGGYLPHPRDDVSVVSSDDHDAILNAERIAEYTAKLEKLVQKVESSGQAKSILKVATAYQQLEEARNHALELIFDEVKYFYPYRGREAEYAPVSKEVDDRVALVREAWESKASARPKKDRSMEKLLTEIEDLELEIGYLGGEAIDLTDRVAKVAKYLDRTLTVKSFFETEEDLELLEYNAETMAANAAADTVATGPEREQVRITNEYRMMMGHRKVLIIQDQLTMAARGHSEDMARVGFFDHFSPVPGKRTPWDRVVLAGYAAEGASENIHMGKSDPQGAHNSWTHSSGHHRNLLSPAWNEMGTGQSGRHWTQNFGYRSL